MAAVATDDSTTPGTPSAQSVDAASSAAADGLSPWIDTGECTACDECTQLNSRIFVYNEEKKAIIKNAEGGLTRTW